MNADAEFLKLVREYLELTKWMTFHHTNEHIEAHTKRRRLLDAVQEIIQRQSQPQLWEGEK